ncbi:uncharacterized protein LOC114523286 [Dendronephthya gigantea]|uniref:uncharacterized protein LOC114523286 n=1 Tax=Dendronephthya gigantea TaxID=151771 RepID=UPI001069ACAF|nr:uncharacterized protein LOC114523286 [Dendronephthya gigantea]
MNSKHYSWPDKRIFQLIDIKPPPRLAYCDLSNNGWTLIARFSNGDAKHWITNGSFWYDKNTPYGEFNDPTNNTDMISSAFWKVKGKEFRVTRNDDSSHTPLLQTTTSCLQGLSFRSKITSYGNFDGKEWAKNECRGTCEVVYSGQYKTTVGFGKHNCNSNLQSNNYIGFWCYWNYDGAVMMIGGGGDDCDRADHGIGITESNSASFGGKEDHFDFGEIDKYLPSVPTTYSLNLWVR